MYVALGLVVLVACVSALPAPPERPEPLPMDRPDFEGMGDDVDMMDDMMEDMMDWPFGEEPGRFEGDAAEWIDEEMAEMEGADLENGADDMMEEVEEKRQDDRLEGFVAALQPKIDEFMMKFGPVLQQAYAQAQPILEKVDKFVQSLVPEVQKMYASFEPQLEEMVAAVQPEVEEIQNFAASLTPEDLAQIEQALMNFEPEMEEEIEAEVAPLLGNKRAKRQADPLQALLGKLQPQMDEFMTKFGPVLQQAYAQAQPILEKVDKFVQSLVPEVQKMYASFEPQLEEMMAAVQPEVEEIENFAASLTPEDLAQIQQAVMNFEPEMEEEVEAEVAQMLKA